MNATHAHAERPDNETIPHVPREPAEYRVTNHFINRLKTRVDDEWHDSLPAQLIRDGRVRMLKSNPTDQRDGTPVALSTTGSRGKVWTLVVAVRDEAFFNESKHRVVTVYQGLPDQERVIE